MIGEEFLTIEEAAAALEVSARHARRLADAGAIDRVARGLLDRDSVEQYLRSRRQGRTRAWAEHTAWGAVAILAGRDPGWLGTTQASRLRRTLRGIRDVDDLSTRLRDRAHVRSFDAHRASLPRLRELVIASRFTTLGVSAAADDHVDGYLAAGDIDTLVTSLGLRANAGGTVTLRATNFDPQRLRDLVDTSVVAALDAATSADPRLRGAGHHALDKLIKAYG